MKTSPQGSRICAEEKVQKLLESDMVDDSREQHLPDIAGLAYVDCDSTHIIQTGSTPSKIQALTRESRHKVLPEPRWYLKLIHAGKRENSFLQRSVTGYIKHTPGQVPNP